MFGRTTSVNPATIKFTECPWRLDNVKPGRQCTHTQWPLTQATYKLLLSCLPQVLWHSTATPRLAESAVWASTSDGQTLHVLARHGRIQQYSHNVATGLLVITQLNHCDVHCSQLRRAVLLDWWHRDTYQPFTQAP